MIQPGAPVPVPPNTGPTGTKGGAKTGTGPNPKTFCIIVLVLYTVKTVFKPKPMASNKVWQCAAVGSAKFAIMTEDKTFAASAASPGEANAISGIGMFGIGGATGPGTAANAGYCKDPVKPMDHCIHALPTALDMASEYLFSTGVFLGAFA